MNNLMEILNSDHFQFTKVAETNGGEYAGPCPFCGGTDRFRVWPHQGEGGRYWCRGCGKNGDAIQYLRDAHDLTYQEACEQLGIHKGYISPHETPKAVFTPQESLPPPLLWSQSAQKFINEAQVSLLSAEGGDARAFLNSRGLTEETIKAAGLGWNAEDRYLPRAAFGLAAETQANGRPKKIWIPRGLVIPWSDSGRVIRIRIRRPEPGLGGDRYIVVSGGVAKSPMRFCTIPEAIVVVESELDAILLSQEAGDLLTVIAMGSVAARPDATTHKLLMQSGLILVALDYDAAGAKQSWGFWPVIYRERVRRWPVAVGKDPSDALQKGLDLRVWIQAGLQSDLEDDG